MAFAFKSGAAPLQATTRRANASSLALRRPQPMQISRGIASIQSARRLIRKVAAIEEQETASYEQAQPAVEQQVDAQVPAALQASSSDDDELVELDAAQEDLLKWMLYLDEEGQEEDLDEMVDYDEYGDDEYAEIFEGVEEIMEQSDYDFKVGDKVVGTVYEVDEDGAYVEVGAKAAGFVPLTECSLARLKTPLEVLRPGMRREFVVTEEEDDYGEIILSLGALEANIFWQRIRQLQEEDIPVYVTVAGVNKGGLMVEYHHLEGFVPVSHFGPSIKPDTMEQLIGYEIPVKFLEVDEERERLVFSNRRASADGEVQGFKVGDVVLGTVQSVKPYGAFVDIGGATGLLHISQITHERLTAVDQVLQEGDKIKVMILSQDRDRGRVTLSTKKLEPEPGDMLRNPQKVYENAEEMAANFRARVEAADAVYMDRMDGGAANSAMLAPVPESEQQYAFDA